MQGWFGLKVSYVKLIEGVRTLGQGFLDPDWSASHPKNN